MIFVRRLHCCSATSRASAVVVFHGISRAKRAEAGNVGALTDGLTNSELRSIVKTAQGGKTAKAFGRSLESRVAGIGHGLGIAANVALAWCRSSRDDVQKTGLGNSSNDRCRFLRVNSIVLAKRWRSAGPAFGLRGDMRGGLSEPAFLQVGRSSRDRGAQ